MNYDRKQSLTPGKKAKQQAVMYAFPIIKFQEIETVMKEIGQPEMTVEAMSKPESKMIRMSMEKILEDCTGVTREMLRQPDFFGLNLLKHAELHEESLPELSIQRRM